jgi:hypothetical protein
VSLIVTVVVGIGLIGGGWFAASVFTSPEQRAAAAAPPAAAPILAEVESGNLLDTRTLSGTIRPTDAFDAVLVAAGGGSRSVVTSLNVSKGASVAIGSVVATVNGQPVFALQSPFPLYRDIGVGDSGVDVRSLQDSLKSMGPLAFREREFPAVHPGRVRYPKARRAAHARARDERPAAEHRRRQHRCSGSIRRAGCREAGAGRLLPDGGWDDGAEPARSRGLAA